jgi:hypothetical protein
MKMTKPIQTSLDTKLKLRKFGNMGDTYDQVIRKLMAYAEGKEEEIRNMERQ